MNATETYFAERDAQIKENMKNKDLEIATHHFFEHLVKTNYVKGFTWMGVPILQLPNDLMVLQEIIYKTRPDVIIETGVAFGGMLMFYATILEAMRHGRVIGIDIEIRDHTRLAINRGPLKHRIELYEVDSTSITLDWFRHFTPGIQALVSLDSNHTRDHVLKELRLYSPLVSVGSYIIVFDTTIDVYGHFDPDRNKRPWGPGNSPATAVREFLRENDSFVVDKDIEQKALITAAPGGWLRRIKR